MADVIRAREPDVASPAQALDGAALPLGRTGRRISRIGLGAMALSIQGRPQDRTAAKRVIRRAVELGVTLIDTADVYCLDDHDIGHNERLIREALDEVGAGDEVVVATKGGLRRPAGRWERDARPERLRAACERSLAALRLKTIGLYQLHAPDPAVALEESVGELARLMREGKIQAVGLSNVGLDELRRAQRVVEITSVQNRFNPWDRSSESEGVIAYCDESAITFLPYSPVGGSQRVAHLRRSRRLRELGSGLEASPEELVLAWILSRSPTLCPIPGASRVESIESSVRATRLELGDEALVQVERAFAELPSTG